MIKKFYKLFLFFLIVSCNSNDNYIELPEDTNNSDDQNEFAEIEYGLTEYGITFQGIDRDFSVYIPESYTHDSPSSMIFVFHGFGGLQIHEKQISLMMENHVCRTLVCIQKNLCQFLEKLFRTQ